MDKVEEEIEFIIFQGPNDWPALSMLSKLFFYEGSLPAVGTVINDHIVYPDGEVLDTKVGIVSEVIIIFGTDRRVKERKVMLHSSGVIDASFEDILASGWKIH